MTRNATKHTNIEKNIQKYKYKSANAKKPESTIPTKPTEYRPLYKRERQHIESCGVDTQTKDKTYLLRDVQRNLRHNVKLYNKKINQQRNHDNTKDRETKT